MLAMMSLSLWTLSVLLLQNGAQGARMVSGGVGGELPPCQFHWQVPGWDCNDASSLTARASNPEDVNVLPPCEFTYQRAGVDCQPWYYGPKTSTSLHSPATAKDNIVPTTPVSKISWIHCLKCMEILVTCGCIIAEFLIAVPTDHSPPAHALDFYNVDTSVPPFFAGVTILADGHDTPGTDSTKAMRVWKSGYGYDPSNVHPAINLSSLSVICDPLKCINTLHNCWKCLGHGDHPPPPATAAFNFHSGIGAPFYDVAVDTLTASETKTARVWKMGTYPEAQPFGNWRANFSLGDNHLEISFAPGA